MSARVSLFLTRIEYAWIQFVSAISIPRALSLCGGIKDDSAARGDLTITRLRSTHCRIGRVAHKNGLRGLRPQLVQGRALAFFYYPATFNVISAMPAATLRP